MPYGSIQRNRPATAEQKEIKKVGVKVQLAERILNQCRLLLQLNEVLITFDSTFELGSDWKSLAGATRVLTNQVAIRR